MHLICLIYQWLLWSYFLALVERSAAVSDDEASSPSNGINKFLSFSLWITPFNVNSSGRKTISSLRM